ncbi:DUF3157 family protein [Flavivirga algicola]|uniref:DUF3157 family protein n=1 Tax=Flavivirga algicola TaxID=2729136 RepID=A0ABX1RW89_9FLAO|nr:DUF3157 family protein [Flavivirga algicola]NMH87426.1 DUF3157 family protein [Flavivirga algicola]
MKTFFFLLLFVVSFTGFAQNNHIIKTEDGRRVLLKADFTWEYIDAKKPNPVVNNDLENSTKPKKDKECNLAEDFVEPKLNRKIQAQLKRGRATMAHVKKKVAKDYNCEATDILLIAVSEQKEKAVYHFCIKGTKTTYKRIGNSIVKKDTFF